jgi:hypothetical protein
MTLPSSAELAESTESSTARPHCIVPLALCSRPPRPRWQRSAAAAALSGCTLCRRRRVAIVRDKHATSKWSPRFVVAIPGCAGRAEGCAAGRGRVAIARSKHATCVRALQSAGRSAMNIFDYKCTILIYANVTIRCPLIQFFFCTKSCEFGLRVCASK